MCYKEKDTVHKKLSRISFLSFVILWSLPLLVSGCFSPKALEHVVIAYDESVTRSLVEQLLINIARAHHHQPVHFTAISSIAATFDYRYTAGATPPLGGLDGGFKLSPIFGATIAENPTFTISPIEGEDFTQRLLTPLREAKLTLLLRQGVDIDLLLRLMAGEIRMTTNGRETAFYNRPADQAGYPIFRQVVLHLSRLQDTNQLYVEPLVYDREWTLPLSSLSATDFHALETNYRVIVDKEKQLYIIQTVDRAYRHIQLRPGHHPQFRAIGSPGQSGSLAAARYPGRYSTRSSGRGIPDARGLSTPEFSWHPQFPGSNHRG